MNKNTLETYRRSKDMIQLHNEIVSALADIATDTSFDVEILECTYGRNEYIYLNNYFLNLNGRNNSLLASLFVKFTYKNKSQYLACFLTDNEYIFNYRKGIQNNIVKTDSETDQQKRLGKMYNLASLTLQEAKRHNINISYGIFSSKKVSVKDKDTISLLSTGFMYGSLGDVLKGLKAFLRKVFYINLN